MRVASFAEFQLPVSQKARVVQEAGAIHDHQRDGSNTRGERLKFHGAVLRACVVFCQPWVADDFITDPNLFSNHTRVHSFARGHDADSSIATGCQETLTGWQVLPL